MGYTRQTLGDFRTNKTTTNKSIDRQYIRTIFGNDLLISSVIRWLSLGRDLTVEYCIITTAITITYAAAICTPSTCLSNSLLCNPIIHPHDMVHVRLSTSFTAAPESVDVASTRAPNIAFSAVSDFTDMF